MSGPATPASRTRVVATDANIVINFIQVGMLADLPAMVDMDFVIADEVYEEITRPEQREILDAALAAGAWSRESLMELEAIELFATLAVTMGRGEAASLALAVTRGCFVASDERKVFLREARQRLGERRIVNTPGLLVRAIQRGTLTVDAADAAKAVLEARNFRMKFGSFAELLR